jgi:hypothetical protein
LLLQVDSSGLCSCGCLLLLQEACGLLPCSSLLLLLLLLAVPSSLLRFLSLSSIPLLSKPLLLSEPFRFGRLCLPL